MYIICTSAHLPFERLTVELLLIHIEGLGCPLVGEEKAWGRPSFSVPQDELDKVAVGREVPMCLFKPKPG